MAKVIKQEGEEKYAQDIFLNMKEYVKLVRSQISGEDFRPSHFITLYDKSVKRGLSYFLSEEKYDTEATISNPFMKFAPLSEYGGKEELQKVKQILDEAKITIEFTDGKCERCKKEKTLTELCETCGHETCPECMVIKDLKDEFNICFDCIADSGKW